MQIKFTLSIIYFFIDEHIIISQSQYGFKA